MSSLKLLGNIQKQAEKARKKLKKPAVCGNFRKESEKQGHSRIRDQKAAGKAAEDLRRREFRRRLSQTQRSELPSGESGLLSLRTRGSTPLCSTRREALKSLDFRAFLFSPGYGGNGALARLPESAFSIVTGSIVAILHK